MRGRCFVVVRVLLENGIESFDRVFVVFLAYVEIADVVLRVGRQIGAGIVLDVIAKLLHRQIALSTNVVAIGVAVGGLGAHPGRRRRRNTADNRRAASIRRRRSGGRVAQHVDQVLQVGDLGIQSAQTLVHI